MVDTAAPTCTSEYFSSERAVSHPSFHSMWKYHDIKKKSRWIPFTVGYREMNQKLQIRTLSLRAPSEEVQNMSPPSMSLWHIDYLN